MKTLKILLAVLLALLLMLTVMACGTPDRPSDDDDDDGKAEQRPSEDKPGEDQPDVKTESVGLEYKIDGDSCSVIGIGSCKDTEIYIPQEIEGKKVTVIGAKAFEGNTTITKIWLPDTVKTIERRAFMDCSELTEINIPQNVSSISTQILDNCDKLTTLYYYTSKEFSDFKLADISSIKEVVYGGSQVGMLFRENTTIEEIILLDSVTSLSTGTYLDGAFFGCENLKIITIPENIKIIDNDTFNGCKNLISVNIPENVTNIHANAFRKCESLTSITIPDSVTVLSSNIFAGCKNLTSITIPDSITKIDSGAFSGCESLTDIAIPDSVISIGGYAFYGCKSLKTLKIPASVTNIATKDYNDLPSLTFFGCVALESIVVDANNPQYYSDGNCLIEKESKTLILGCKNSIIPETAESIGLWAFAGCTDLTEIIIPDNIVSIGDYAFSGCTGLATVILPYNIEDENVGAWIFADCLDLNITIGKMVEKAGFWSGIYAIFYDCENVTITIADGVTSIPGYVFRGGGNITTLIIPKSITEIQSYACVGCEKLSNITYCGTVAEWKQISKSWQWWGDYYEYVATNTVHCTDGDVAIQ